MSVCVCALQADATEDILYPVNLLLIAVCCMIVFGMINHFVDKQAAQSHYSSVQHNILALQTSLKNIERQMVVSQENHRLMQSDPLIHSVYLYAKIRLHLQAGI